MTSTITKQHLCNFLNLSILTLKAERLNNWIFLKIKTELIQIYQFIINQPIVYEIYDKVLQKTQPIRFRIESFEKEKFRVKKKTVCFYEMSYN